MSYITVEELNKKLDGNEEVIVIDVRSKLQYDEGHIKGALNIPMMKLSIESDDLDMEKEVIVYCNSGKSSSGALLFLEDKGFKVKNLKGGFNEYISNRK